MHQSTSGAENELELQRINAQKFIEIIQLNMASMSDPPRVIRQLREVDYNSKEDLNNFINEHIQKI